MMYKPTKYRPQKRENNPVRNGTRDPEITLVKIMHVR